MSMAASTAASNAYHFQMALSNINAHTAQVTAAAKCTVEQAYKAAIADLGTRVFNKISSQKTSKVELPKLDAEKAEQEALACSDYFYQLGLSLKLNMQGYAGLDLNN
jgi:hypothetical protein